jgi:hypothetical protein
MLEDRLEKMFGYGCYMVGLNAFAILYSPILKRTPSPLSLSFTAQLVALIAPGHYSPFFLCMMGVELALGVPRC